MRERLRYTALALGAILLIGGVAQATGGSSKGGGSQTLRFLDVSDKFEFVDVGEPAESESDFGPGDMLIFNNLLRNRADTKELGSWISICTMTASPGVARCSGTLGLDQGDIDVATTVDFADADRIVAAVTGGTGDFQGAGGEVILGDQTNAGRKLTVKLVR